MQIRKATIDDASISFAIRREAIRAQCQGHYSPRDLEIWTAGEMSEVFARRVADHFHVAVVDGRVVGTGMIDLVSGKIDAVFVAPEYMGRGIGHALMAYLERLAIAAERQEVHLDATLNAAPFYRAMGFEGSDTAVYESSLGVSLVCVPMTKYLRAG
ncbi:GNAT family N-acetyltransferase [Dyella amyloliquefaciens]|uniref:GNAT family N-acetyltransferase n=1 Tax=Dyella amyloliquefaciens TaxID=1770545 RepID=UPI00102E8159|nr:GNAT family N-acetyltransferase [Dyella amyloliquefaciens]